MITAPAVKRSAFPLASWTRRMTATPVRRALVIVTVWRVALAVWGITSEHLLAPGPTAGQTLMHHGWANDFFSKLVDSGVRNDSWWYATIAQHGYSYSSARISSVAFFPLYPITIKVLSVVTGSVFSAGMIIPSACLFGWVCLLARWMERRGLGAQAPLTVALMVCFPLGFFFSAMYTESLFLMLALAAFLWFEEERWIAASVAAFFAAATRPTGLILVPCFVVMIYLRRHSSTGTTSRDWKQWLAVVAGPTALVAYCLYQWFAFGNALAWLHAEAMPPWSRDLSRAVRDVMLQPRPGFASWYLAIMLAIGIGFLGLTPMIYRRFGAPYAVWNALAVLFPMASGLISMDRYVLVSFPAFASVACCRQRRSQAVLLISGFYLLLALSAFFVNGYTVL